MKTSLHQQFMKIVKDRNRLTYMLLDLLPSIYESGEYKKYARTIEGYAYRFAQIPESTVRKTLNLHKHIHDKPDLKKIVSEVGVHKVALIATLATTENQKILAEKAKNMSIAALQDFSKLLRNGSKTHKVTFNLNQDQLGLLNLVKKKLGIEMSDEMIIEKLCMQFLGSEVINDDEQFRLRDEQILALYEKSENSRYVPVKLKKQALNKYNNFCAFPTCENQASEIHHQVHFAKSRNHEKIIGLCKVHHEFMHNNLIADCELDPQYWRLQVELTVDKHDLKYQKMRN